MWIFNFLSSLWGSSGIKVTGGVLASALLLSSSVYHFNLAGQGIQWEAPPLLGELEKMETIYQNVSKVMGPAVPDVSGSVGSEVPWYPLGGFDGLFIIPQFEIKLPSILGTDNAGDENDQCTGLYYFRPNCLGITGLPFIQMPMWPLSLWNDCKFSERWMWHLENMVDDITCLNQKLNHHIHHLLEPASDYTYQWLSVKFQYGRKLVEAAFRHLLDNYHARFTHEEVERMKAALTEFSMEKLNATQSYLFHTSQHASIFFKDQWKTVKHSYNGCINRLDLSWFHQDPEVMAMDVMRYCANAVYDAAWLVFVFPFVTAFEGVKICAYTLVEVCLFPFRVDSYVHWNLTPECLTPEDIMPIVEEVIPDEPCHFYEFVCVRAAFILYQRLFVPFWMYLGHIIVFAYRYTMIYHLICMAFGNHICYPPLCIFHRYQFTIPDLGKGLFEEDE